MGRYSLIKKRNKLFNQNPHCCYCDCELISPDKIIDNRNQPDNMATLDHIFDKNHPIKNKFIVVLACKKCNNERSNGQNKTVLIKDLEKILGNQLFNNVKKKYFDFPINVPLQYIF